MDRDTTTPDHEDELTALLIIALDGADETRIRLMTRLAMSLHDVDLERDIERMRRDGPDPVCISGK